MDERFTCPNCGKELTTIGVELDRLRRNQEELTAKLGEILRTVFDSDELMRVSDRSNNDVS